MKRSEHRWRISGQQMVVEGLELEVDRGQTHRENQVGARGLTRREGYGLELI